MTALAVAVLVVLGTTPWSVRRAVGGLGAGRGRRGADAQDGGWADGGRGRADSGWREGWRPDGGRPDGGRPEGVRPGRGRPDRRPSSSRGVGAADEPDPALLLDLVAVALAAGSPVPAALATVGESWPGAAGEALVRAARALALGASWDVAWAGPRGGPRGGARAVANALGPAWATGASPVPLLRTAADRARSTRRAATRAAAGRLGVQLVVPLALCYLPAFVLVGLVPVVVSLAGGLLG